MYGSVCGKWSVKCISCLRECIVSQPLNVQYIDVDEERERVQFRYLQKVFFKDKLRNYCKQCVIVKGWNCFGFSPFVTLSSVLTGTKIVRLRKRHQFLLWNFSTWLIRDFNYLCSKFDSVLVLKKLCILLACT